MRNPPAGKFIIGQTLAVLGCITAAHGELLVYEGFDYSVGADVTSALNGGAGFASAWTPGQQGGKITVYSESGFWDGVVNNVPTSPAAGARYIGGASGDSRITAQRVLSQNAGALAGADKVLWASVVWHQTGSNYGRQVGFTLGTDGLSNRAVNVDKTGTFGAGIGNAIGVGGAINTGLVTPTIWNAGNVAVRTTTGASEVSYSLDNLIVLKFTFADGATADTVTAYRFIESTTPSETTFNTSAISASAVIDQDTLNVLSFSQSLVSNEAIDEIRLGDTFDDVVSGVIGQAPRVFQLALAPNPANPGDYDFTWNSQNGKVYDLVSAADLSTPMTAWPVWHGLAAIRSTPPNNIFDNVPGGGETKRFFAVVERDADPSAPVLNSVWGSGSTITLAFSEAMAASGATDPANFSVVKDGVGPIQITAATLGPDGKTITLTTATPLDIASAFTVTLYNLADLSGSLLGAATTGTFQTYDNNPNGVKVFILAGQSNMVGHGKAEQGVGDVAGAIGSLRYLAVNDSANYGQLLVDPGNPATSAWKTRTDVKVWWRDSDITAARAVLKGDLKIGYGDFRNTTWFGPEYAFGWVMGDHFTEPVLLIKTAWGGKSLHVDFRPPSAVAARGGVVGPYYTGMIEYVRDCLTHLGTEFPEFAGMGYQIAGFGWHQGWNDAGYGAYYEDNLVDLIHDLRTEFGNPSLPVSIGTTGMVGGLPAPYPYTSYTAVEKAQLAVSDPSKHSEFTGTVLTDDTRYYWRDASVSPSNFGYHWNHNGESHFLVGKGLGTNMVNLLAP